VKSNSIVAVLFT